MDLLALAHDVLEEAKDAGADDADVLLLEGTDFSVMVRKGEVETLTDAGSRGLGLRVFVGRRTANSYTSDLSGPALRSLVQSAVDMARATGEDDDAGLPDECPPLEPLDLELFDPALAALLPRDSSFLKDRLGERVASPLITLVDDGRRRRGLGARPTASAERGLGGDPGVGSMDLCFAAGATSPGEIVAGVERGLLVTDLMGFGVDIVSGDYSQGAFGYWIEKGRVTHPVHEITIAGNLAQMLKDVDAVGNDLVFRGSSAAPTVRIRRMTMSGS